MTPTPDLLEALQANLAILREVGLRYNAAVGNTTSDARIMDSPEAVAALNTDMQELVQEQLRVILLRTKQTVIDVVTVYQGTVNAASTRSAEILRPAILANAPGIIVVHNHPSGDSCPSSADLAVTRKLLQAAKVMDIQVFDHVIVRARRGAAEHGAARTGGVRRPVVEERPMSDAWKGRQWRMVYSKDDLDTGTRKCLHAQRNPRMRHLPLPRAGLLVRAITKDGTDCYRETARSRRNERGLINLIPWEFEKS